MSNPEPPRNAQSGGGALDVVDAFLARVASHPNLPAVERNGIHVSYEALRGLAWQIAASVQQVTDSARPRVLVAMPSSAAAYAGMIGSLMASGTFCSLNVEGPDARNREIIRAFSPDVILIDNTARPFVDEAESTTPRVDVSRLGTPALARPVTTLNDVAYVVFTSGSTGQPKGVMVGRAGFSQFLAIAPAYFALTPGERWAQFSNLGYDLAVMDVFMALSQGGTLVPFTSPKERLMPAAAILESRIAIWHSVPSVVDLMIRANQVSPEFLSSLRVMSFCGEPLHRRHLEALFAARPNLEIFNTYGATETTGFNTINRLGAHNYFASCEAPAVALGDDVPGWTLSLQGGSSPDEGEIVVTSEWLSLGYWNDDNQTRRAFRVGGPDGVPTRRSYFTGDWGVRRDGQLYISSRVDRRVKVRGIRVELDEIDGLLRDVGFAAAYTVLLGDELHAFVESTDGVDEQGIQARLAAHLPLQAIPKTVRAMLRLPRNPNGKIDSVALKRQVSR